MISLVSLPQCPPDGDSPLVIVLSTPNPMLWLAGAVLAIGVLLLACNNALRANRAGIAFMQLGMLLGAIPLVSTLLAMATNCADQDVLLRLREILPIANWLTAAILSTSVVGFVWAVYLYWVAGRASAPTAG